ncbi:MAG: exo-alpha-sialidase [Chthonomonadetes bacterium]|nr:exo-alpha-sialidase [Chthonomonadetes bacterium]
MRVTERTAIIPPDERGRPVMPSFITYIHPTEPWLVHCWGRSDYSDAYDDFVLQFSRDNGRTWTEPVLHRHSETRQGGRMRYGEPAALFDPNIGRLLVLWDYIWYPQDQLDVDAHYHLLLETFDPLSGAWTPLQRVTDEPVAVSFCQPIKTRSGRIVVGVQRHYLDESGKPLHYRGCWSPAGIVQFLLGDVQADGSIRWRLSQPVVPDLERTSRGFYEPAVVELRDGRLAAVLRGDNSMFPDKPGYKWLTISEDGGETWSEAVPLPCDMGEPIESSSTGSGIFRSITDGKVYWLGNLCIDGVRPNGNWPRTPLVIAEVQEEPFALRRDSLFVIDRQREGEPPEVQHSNFRFYQDRETGELVILLTRFGERSAERWQDANYYRYRVPLHD